ncbi:MAG: alpha-D-ribose 1-methylphosphonate 5-triphosphate diphosphatase [Natronomonas sp.]|uniref:alpha-D-ribose 1-methylphosphonate 5-triphosphate diphosphatase n=1 Tax=Natronomonas sp. TaxID=2184060 RepID=UPI002870A8BE|nr:alpha-D-ribose 1-methylphosphonate 5-triphosphate diphosphatase [Natronomonas sp.]MDR9431825.1 alpha-D-ribose 1-methylphosphonate 5-triphosphate diphosphatase [Natronomonas sp.]
MTTTTERILLKNGRVVTPDRVIEGGWVVVSGSRIEAVGAASGASDVSATMTVDVEGGVVMPGLVDLHGDDIERQYHPRAEARVDTATALVTTDRLNLCNGVTTKFHAIAFEDDPTENRSPEGATELCQEISSAEYTLGDQRVHARCELTTESVSAVERLIDDVAVDLVSVMHHAPGDGQFDEAGFERHYTANRNCSTEEIETFAMKRRTASQTVLRSQLERVAELAHSRGIPLASHDDETPPRVDAMADLGVELSEYPITLAAARRATERGLTTVMGAPNLVRGHSLWGNLGVRTAIDHGAVDVLCSDYHPPSLLAAPFVETGESLVDRVRRVTAAPATAVGLTDRGRLEPGARADVIVVDPHPIPTIERVFVEGADALRTG